MTDLVATEPALRTPSAPPPGPVRRRRLARVVRAIPYVIVGGYLLVALAGGWFVEYDPLTTAVTDRLLPPGSTLRDGSTAWLGTDAVGRDVFAQVVLGARTSVAIATCTVLVSGVLGVTFGLLAGYLGGWVDTAVARSIDILVAFSIVAPPVFGYAPQPEVGYDPVGARTALEVAGFDFDQTFELQLRGEEFRQFAQAVTSDLRAIGVQVEPVEKEPGVWIDRKRGLIHEANTARAASVDQIDPKIRDELVRRFRQGVPVELKTTEEHGDRPGERKTRLLLEELRDRPDDVLRFATDLRVPPTSNQVERDLAIHTHTSRRYLAHRRRPPAALKRTH